MTRFMTTTAAAVALAALTGCATTGAQTPEVSAPITVAILHTNDFHSRIEPINKFDSTCVGEDLAKNACFGGSARLVTKVRERKAAHEAAGRPVLIVDAGDQSQGSLFYTHYRGTAEAELMGMVGYEAMAVGNHEFDSGAATLAKFIGAAKVPVISANVDASKDDALKGLIAPTAIVTKGGQRIGLIGLTPEDAGELTAAGKNVAFTDAVAATQAAVAALEGQGVNKIILLSHSGYARDKEIAAAVKGVDLIVGGHSHTYLYSGEVKEGAQKPSGPYPTMVKDAAGKDTPIVTAYAYGKYLGDVSVSFDAAGNVTKVEGAPILLDSSIAEDNAVKARVADLAKPLAEIKAKVVGSATAAIDGSRDNCRAKECAMGNLVTEAMLARTRAQGVTIALQNGGGVRAGIDAGDITMGEVLTVLPFQNTLATVQLKGSDIVKALEGGVSKVEEGHGRFPQVAGLRFEWTRSKPADGGRILKVEVSENGAWAPINPDKVYTVATNNFVRGGGDGYKVFASGAKPYDFGPNMEEVVVDYLASLGGSYAPALDGRIKEVP